MKGKILQIILSLSCINVFAETVENFQVNAKIEDSCYLKAENINFGEVRNLIKTREMSGALKVKCSKNLNYQIGLDSLNMQVNGENKARTANVSISNNSKNNAQTGNGQVNNPNNNGQVNNGNKPNNGNGNGNNKPNNGNGNGNNKPNNGNGEEIISPSKPESLPKGERVLLGKNTSEYLQYSIKLPYDLSKEWIVGENSFYSKGTGVEQSIPINISITENTRILPEDTYVDTVLITLTY